MVRTLARAIWILVALALCSCVAGPVNPSFPLGAAEAHQAIERMRQDPKKLPHPLVIVGGFADPDILPQLLKSFFGGITQDTRIIPVSMGLCHSFEQCRERVIDAVDDAVPSADPNWTSEVDVVGLSLGGLVARYCAAPSRDPRHPRRLRIAQLFTISSPHSGAALAKTVGLTQFHRDMMPGSEFLQYLSRFDAQASYRLVAYVHLDDEIVGDTHAAPAGQNVYWLANDAPFFPHLGAMLDRRILADIARRLRGEAPFTLSPPAPLPPG